MSGPTSVFEATGIDGICDMLIAGKSFREIAAEHGVTQSALSQWLANDANRSARANRARAQAAELWDYKAEEGIREAADPFQLAKARDLAHHYRWRAAKINPREYGERTQVAATDTEGNDVQITDMDAAARIAGILALADERRRKAEGEGEG